MRICERVSIVGLAIFATALAKAEIFTLKDPEKGLFKAGTKVVDTVYTAEWLIQGGAGLFAITCFVGAANLSRQGNYGRAAGAVIGGIIASLGAYLVKISQT